MTSPTLLASAEKGLWRLSNSLNLDAQQLFLDAGLDPSKIDETHSRYDIASVINVWELAGQRAGLRHIGLKAAQHYKVTDSGALGIAFLTSHNLLEALERLSRYVSLMNTDYDCQIEVAGDRVYFTGNSIDTSFITPPVLEDTQNAVLIGLCRLGIDGPMDPIEVSFTYPKPDDISDYLDFFSCEVRFAQPKTGFCFSRENAERGFTTKNRDIARASDEILDKYLGKLNTLDISSKVKYAILDRLPSGAPTEREIAETLHMTSRTLSRRLADEGTNYRQLLVSVRKDLAEQYIADESVPMTEISYMLGFAGLSSFSRAFKTWNGESPKVSRDRLNR